MVGYGDAQRGAPGFDLGLPGAAVPRRVPVLLRLALVIPRQPVAFAGLVCEIAHGQTTAASCITILPKRSALVAALGSSIAVNSKASPTGTPF